MSHAPSRGVAARCDRLAFLALIALVAACGDDGGTPPGLDTTDMDAASAIDAGPDAAGEDARVVPPPPTRDAGGDAQVTDDARTPDPDDDAGAAACRDLDCSVLGDECNVGVCDPVTVECRAQPRADGTACGSSTLDNCSAPDSCLAGQCVPNHASAGSPCGDTNTDCRVDDTCDGNGVCVDNGLAPENSLCGEPGDSDCDDPDTCDDQGVCRPNHAPIDSLCGDVGVPCRNDDRCDGRGECIDSGTWALGQCPGGQVNKDGQNYCLCGSNARTECHPGPDVCIDGTCRLGHEQFAPNGMSTDGLPCGNQNVTDPECDNPDACSGGVCEANGEPAGTLCGDQSINTTCNGRDACDGFGNCDPKWAPPTTTCGDQAGECLLEPRCNGGGSCQLAAPAPPGTGCGDDTETTCDLADICDGAGECDPNYAGTTIVCGDAFDGECTDPDTCDGAGACGPNHEPAGTLCGETGRTCIQDPSCDEDGQCIEHGVASPCTVHGQVLAGGVGAPGVLVQVIGGDSAVTDANGEYDLDVPVQTQFLLRFGDTSGYWGSVRVRRFDPEQLASGLLSSLASDASVEAIAAEVAPPLAVDRGKGLVQVNFGGSAAGGGEGATLSAASAMSIVVVPPDSFAYGTENHAQEGFMTLYNVEPGTTSVTPVDGDTNTCSLAYTPPSSQWPIFAHTVTVVPVRCD